MPLARVKPPCSNCWTCRENISAQGIVGIPSISSGAFTAFALVLSSSLVSFSSCISLVGTSFHAYQDKLAMAKLIFFQCFIYYIANNHIQLPEFD